MKSYLEFFQEQIECIPKNYSAEGNLIPSIVQFLEEYVDYEHPATIHLTVFKVPAVEDILADVLDEYDFISLVGSIPKFRKKQ